MQNQRFELIKRLREYVNDELSDNQYYMELAKMASSDNDRAVLEQIAEDQKKHAATFSNAIYLMTGKKYVPPQIERPHVPPNYKQALKERIHAETKDYRKYGEEYIKAPNQHLTDAFFKAMTDENVHALKLLYLLS